MERREDLALEVGLDLAGLIAEAESSIRALNQGARPALIPLARFLLKAESIASSKVEGLQLSVRELARAEARLDIGEDTEPPEEITGEEDQQLAVYYWLTALQGSLVDALADGRGGRS